MAIQLQIYLLIPRIIETILFLMIILRVNGQFKSTPFRKRPLVHRLFLQGLSGWLIYIFLDIFIYTFAAASFDPAISIRVVGYNVNYPSLFYFNIARDIAFAGLMIESWSYLFVPIAIHKGEHKVSAILQKPLIKYSIILYSVFLVLNENLVVLINANKTVIITEDYEGIGALSLLSATVLFLLAAMMMWYVFRKTLEAESSRAFQKKLVCFLWGIFLMGLGYLWAIFWNVMYAFLPVLAEPVYYLLVSYVIHGCWMASPILIALGLNISDDQLKNLVN